MKYARCWPLLLLLAGGCTSRQPAVTASPAVDGAQASVTETVATENESAAAPVRLSIVSFDEIQERIAAQRGKVVVMDAWSTSCPPCIKEFPHLVELHKKYPPEKLACMSLSFDYEGLGKPEEQIEGVLKFLRKQGATFENLLSSEESDVLYRKLKLAAVPAVFVYDQNGQLRKRFDNEHAKSKDEAFSYEQVGKLVAELLEQRPPAEKAD